ncbi:MAG: aspartyl protease family protein [Pirellulales bacterium]
MQKDNHNSGAVMRSKWPRTLVYAFAFSYLLAEDGFGGCSSVIEEFDVFGDGDCLLVPVNIDDKIYTFLIDTGATFVIFDEALAGTLGQTVGSVAVQALEEEKEITLRRAPRNLSIGALPLKLNLPVACQELTAVREATGDEVYGILGMDPLWDCTIQIDFDRGKLSFLTAVGSDIGERLDLHHGASGTPKIAAKSCLGTEYWTVDTGHVRPNGASVSSVDFLILSRRKSAKLLMPTLATSLSGGVTERNALLGTLSFGNCEVGNLIASEHLYYDHNLLALAFWSRFNITFDFPHSAMYLKKNRSFDRPDRVDLSGACFLRRRGKTIVDAVEKGSAADSAGMRSNDIVESINGVDAGQMRLFALRRVCATPNKAIEMAITRNGTRSNIRLVLPGQ